MGCGDSKPTLSLDDFKSPGEDKDVEAKVDKKSIKALWDKKYSKFELTDKELNELTPGEPITEKNEDTFPEFKEKFLKLVEKKRRLDEIEKNPMPYLKQYFPLWAKKAKTLLEPSKLYELISSGQDVQEYMKQEMGAWFNSTGKPLLQKSFDHHDTNANGVLDADEAAVFYKHLVEMKWQVVDEMLEPLMMAGAKAMATVAFKPNERDMAERVVKEKFAPLLVELREKVANVVKDYKENQAEKDKAAFAVMDVNGDGTLIVEEFLSTMMPLSDKYNEFWAAIGFTSEMMAGGDGKAVQIQF